MGASLERRLMGENELKNVSELGYPSSLTVFSSAPPPKEYGEELDLN